MKSILGTVIVAMAISALPAAAQAIKLDTHVPSAQNSGAGIPGNPGIQSGPAARFRTATNEQVNPTVKDQDTAEIAGLPGNKNGPPAKPRGRT
jgi:hypothetical protein